MAKTFTITTTATDTLKADAKGHAEAVYTVTNTSSRPVRGMAKATALDSTKGEWLKITGDTERDFPPGGTQQIVVTFDSPLTAAPAGPPTADKYSFRLDVASATNPDEDFTEGPVVKVELPAPEPVVPSKPFPKWIFIPIAVVLLLIIGTVLFLVLRKSEPEKYVLPNVASTAEADAKLRLESECQKKTGCVVVAVTPIADSTVAQGLAIRTEPVEGTPVDVGSNVTMFISTGPEKPPEQPVPVETYKLPAVANQPEEKAKLALAGKCETQDPCVEVEVSRINDNKVANGLALRSEPQEGTQVNVGSKVTLLVSKGPDKVTILSVAGLPADDGREKLRKSCGSTDCLDVEVNVIPENKVANGKVIGTEPAAGVEVNVGSKVKMFVSGGANEVVLPYVRTRPAADAVKILEGACKPLPCFKVTQQLINDDEVPSGRAVRTIPLEGIVKSGSNVTLLVSTGPEIRVVGDYKNMAEQLAKQKIVSDGFTVGTVLRKPYLTPVPVPKVISQDPPAGSKQPRRSKVNLVVLGNRRR